jgi:hypothetical protein
MSDLITKDTYRADIFTFDLEKYGSVANMTISNSISWDWMKMKLTQDELKGLRDFINNFLEN